MKPQQTTIQVYGETPTEAIREFTDKICALVGRTTRGPYTIQFRVVLNPDAEDNPGEYTGEDKYLAEGKLWAWKDVTEKL